MTWFPITGASLAVDLANTTYFRDGVVVDGLAVPGGVRDWLVAVADRLEGADPVAEAEDAVRLRDAIRSLFEAAGAPDAGAVAVVNAAAAAAPARTVLAVADGGSLGTTTQRGPASAAALATIADDAIRLLAGPGAAAPRRCTAHGCVGFYLPTDARRRFCSARCSARDRVARHYRRHR